MQDVRQTEKTLQRDVTQRVESGLPGVEVLALELVSPQRFCVYVDHPGGVDHALCERVTNVLRGYLDRYSIDVSSPGFERPLRLLAASSLPSSARSIPRRRDSARPASRRASRLR